MELFDIGVNLTHAAFRRDLAAVLERARQASVSQIVVTGTSESASRAAQALAADYPEMLYATAGVHPHDARHWSEHTATALEALAAMPQVVALGEMGLDFNRDFSPRPEQERIFEAQLELAATVGLPVFMHERDARERFVMLLNRYRHRLGAAVIHCFTGTADDLAAYRDLDLHIGVTGWICDERRGLHLRDLVKRIPLERLMLETDAPFLLPRTIQPKPKDRRNEPAFLPYVVNAVAEALALAPQTVAKATTQTARRFFRLL